MFKTQKRQLNLQEYQSKKLLKENGCYVQQFFVIDKHTDEEIFDDYDFNEYVVKAQVLAGGRKKGYFIDGYLFQSGVVITSSKEKAKKSALGMLGHRLVTNQTGPEGVIVNKVMIARSVPIIREAYLSFLMDPSADGPVVVACPVGGVDIEEVAEKHPELILKEPICLDEDETITSEQRERIVKCLNFDEFANMDLRDQLDYFYKFFIKYDVTQLEINPIAQVLQSLVFSIDAKLKFDENAAFRQKRIFEMKTGEEMSEKERLAKKCGLSYIPMDGNIACLVNGAGLAMATMDIIKLHGGQPANFLDVGGSATVEQVCNAFKIIASNDPKIKAIFVNIFAGILRCDIVAEGVITACNELEIGIPVVLRLKGTNVDEAKLMLKNASSQLKRKFEFFESFDDAAKHVVKLASESETKKECCG